MPAVLNDHQTHKFRPGLDTWLGRVALPLTFLLVLAFTAINLLKAHPGYMWLALTLILTIGMAASVYAIPVIFGQIKVGRSGLWANIDGMRLDVLWKDIRALRVSVQNSEPYLIIGVGAGIFVVPLRQFDVKAIWSAIRQNGPQDAMRPEAFDAYTRNGGNEGIPPDLWMVGSLRGADSRGLVIASGAGTVGFIGLFVVSIVVGLPGAMVFLAFSILYLLALLNIGYTELDLRGITRRTVFGTTRIQWDELAAVVMGPFGLRIALEGMRGQRLVLFGPPVWTGTDAARAVHFLALQISTRRVPRRRSLLALFQASRNTRVEENQ